MRTHRTFSPSPAAEPDTGGAASDEEYDKASQDKTRVVTLVNPDEYALGRYAGI